MNGFLKELGTTFKEIFIVSWILGIGIFLIGLGVVFFIPAGLFLIPIGFYITIKGFKKTFAVFIAQRKRHNPIIEKIVNNIFGLPPRPRA
ncbi:hypothetical protein [Pelosinus baikalensis]|uniref:Transmembrane protein n=1 Tax=Pelosinus baikalensis TaxID=2892015 RepID=A0ABS8HSP1_9FIRM|nr:hypothetical protein [Pelosinus baikalensis]MCC5465539.1 hypothetical protein [Pelosinus baikalensis]